MPELPSSLVHHRVQAHDIDSVVHGEVRYSPLKSMWFFGMALAALVGGITNFTWIAFLVFLAVTATVLLLGHSLGSHRKLIHDSYQCPKWLEYTLVYCGVQVGLAGPLGLLRQHELRDYAQRLPDCHDYLRHGSSFWRDAWWQLHCELHLDRSPRLTIEPRIADDRFYALLERTWMLQQIPPALLLYLVGGWGFVFWGTCARVTAGVLGHWLIGYYAHNRGVMHYEVHGAAVQGRNIRFASLLTMGESWHNNHHAFPGSARLGLFAGEWDPGWWILMALRKLGLVWNVKLPAALPPRAELRARDAAAHAEDARRVDIGAGHARARVNELAGAEQVLQMCLIARAPATDRRWTLSGPAAPLSASVIRSIVGDQLPFRQSEGANRLVLSADGRNVLGLPALCIALCSRNSLLRAVGFAGLPFALGFEQMREAFDVT
jgi:fatty-acid desaturase